MVLEYSFIEADTTPHPVIVLTVKYQRKFFRCLAFCKTNGHLFVSQMVNFIFVFHVEINLLVS